MSVERQGNWLGQQRVDIPHIRAIESSIAADFDLLAGSILAGKAPLVINGFDVITTGITLPTALKIRVADSTLIHFNAAEAGSIFHVPADRTVETLSPSNPRVTGSFLPSQVNYVGLDLVRSADSTTTDQVQFMDPNTLAEGSRSVPLARTLDYRIVISAADFDSNPGLLPIAKVTTDTDGSIITVVDARNICWRLGSGGSSPNRLNSYAWPGGRTETNEVPFAGGDKAIGNQKDWQDAVMTRLWELGGGEHWYSPTEDHNVVMKRSGSVFAGSGEYFEWSGTHLHWKGLTFLFTNSTGTFNDVANQTTDLAGLTDLADGDCIYIDLDRTQSLSGGSALVAAKAPRATLGSPSTPGSRWIIAWRVGSNIFTRDQSYAVGSAFKIATIAAAGDVKLSATDGGAVTPARVATVDSLTFKAYAAGLSRGGDFSYGAGDITIGGVSEDHNVILKTTEGAYETYIEGINRYPSDGTAALTVQQLYPFDGMGGDIRALTLRLRGFNDGAGRAEDAHQFEIGGAIGFRNAATTMLAPVTTTTSPIRSKVFFQTNNLSTPDTRDQFCIMWFNGDIDVIAESPTY